MKIVKRVSLYRAVERLGELPLGAPKMMHTHNESNAHWKMPIDVELLKYGYRNKPRTYTMGILAVLACMLGLTLHTTEYQLRNNEVKTIYSYRIREYMQSTIWLSVRRILHQLFPQLISGQMFPLYEYFKLTGVGSQNDEKHIRYQQYKYYMKRKDNKYDFMELGVLEKFPYPITDKITVQE